MKKVLLMATCALVGFSGAASAGELYVSPKLLYARQKIEDPRVRVGGGKAQETTRKDNAEGLGFAVGYNLKPMRFETELAFRNNLDTRGAKLEARTLLVNGYYDFHNSTNFTPYVGAGVGLSSIDFKIKNDNFSKSDSSTNFAWNVGGGVSYSFCDKSAIDLGYRFIDYGKAQFSKDIGGGTHLKVHGRMTGGETLLGYRYNL